MKRVLDVVLSAVGLVASAPVLLPSILLVYLGDRKSPFYIAPRVGRDEAPFQMVKLRSMIVGADKSGMDSTSSNDERITRVGGFVRRYKVDELPQLVNVLKGEMSLVGPRPNVQRETSLYTSEEKRLLTVRPGITDLASIVFADENDILAGSTDPDLDYNRLIRPWKSRLGLLYVDNSSIALDLRIIGATIRGVVSRERALARVDDLLGRLDCDPELREVAKRQAPLVAHPPPGATEVVTSRGPAPRGTP